MMRRALILLALSLGLSAESAAGRRSRRRLRIRSTPAMLVVSAAGGVVSLRGDREQLRAAWR